MNAAEIFLAIYYPIVALCMTIGIRRTYRKYYQEFHPHNWQPWPNRPGWQFCPGCSACREES
jgi:hypothetical protein